MKAFNDQGGRRVTLMLDDAVYPIMKRDREGRFINPQSGCRSRDYWIASGLHVQRRPFLMCPVCGHMNEAIFREESGVFWAYCGGSAGPGPDPAYIPAGQFGLLPKPRRGRCGTLIERDLRI